MLPKSILLVITEVKDLKFTESKKPKINDGIKNTPS